MYANLKLNDNKGLRQCQVVKSYKKFNFMFKEYGSEIKVKLISFEILQYGVIKCVFKLSKKRFFIFNYTYNILAFKPLKENVNQSFFKYTEYGNKRNAYINCFLCTDLQNKSYYENSFITEFPKEKSTDLFGTRIDKIMNDLLKNALTKI